MSRRSDTDLVQDMLEAARRAIDYCADLDFAEFAKDARTQDAVIRNIEILGEAAKGLSEKIRNRHSELPWGNITGMRDRLIHDYFGVNWDIVWDVVAKDLPELVDKLNRIQGQG